MAPLAEVDACESDIAQRASVASDERDEFLGVEAPALDAERAEPLPLQSVGDDGLEWEVEGHTWGEPQVDGG